VKLKVLVLVKGLLCVCILICTISLVLITPVVPEEEPKQGPSPSQRFINEKCNYTPMHSITHAVCCARRSSVRPSEVLRLFCPPALWLFCPPWYGIYMLHLFKALSLSHSHKAKAHNLLIFITSLYILSSFISTCN